LLVALLLLVFSAFTLFVGSSRTVTSLSTSTPLPVAPLPTATVTQVPVVVHPTDAPTTAPVPAAVPTVALVPSTATELPIATPPPTATVPPTPAVVDISRERYLDDRSTPIGLLESYFNALNRKELGRAYSYWSIVPGSNLPAFGAFQSYFVHMVSASISFGAMTQQGAAGNFYYTAAVLVTTTWDDRTNKSSVDCYRLHLPNPAMQEVPPVRPMAVESIISQPAASADDGARFLPTVCKDAGLVQPATSATPTPNPSDIGPTRYVDDRSDPVQVLRSLFNAINRKEFARAYSYWEGEPGGSLLPRFPDYRQGYANTASVDLTIGSGSQDFGAGQVYFNVPVTLQAKNADNSAQSFVGCYTLHLGRPEIQTAPPFHPMAIIGATVQQVPSNADFAALMKSACK
jgi:hypothetical protein